MRVIAFLGSPRKGGNSDLLLSSAIQGIEETGIPVSLFRLNELNISPCQNCGGCDETGECILSDDMTQIYPAIRSADRIILASPIFFSALSAQTKAMIDRCQCIWCEKYLLGKSISPGPFGRKGLLLLVGGMKKAIGERGMECAETSATAFFRSISIPEHKTLRYTGIDAKGAIANHPTALKEAFQAGKELIKISE